MFQCLFYLSVKDLQSYCSVKLVDKFAMLNKSDFVLSAEAHTGQDFRNIQWADYIHWLDTTCQKNQSIGNFNSSQVDFLHQHLPNSATVSFNYQESEYRALLKQFAELHLYRLDLGLLPFTSFDLENKTIDQRIECYINLFDQQQVIPRFVQQPADVCVQLTNLCEIDQVTGYLNQLGIELSTAGQDFYNQWLSKNFNLFG